MKKIFATAVIFLLACSLLVCNVSAVGDVVGIMGLGNEGANEVIFKGIPHKSSGYAGNMI